MQNIQKKGKMVTLGHFSVPGPTRKLRDEATSLSKSNLARPGELLCNLHPSFVINKREGAEGKRFQGP